MMLTRICLALAIFTLSVATAQAVAILDQEYDFQSSVANSTNGNVGEIGQTFTVGIAGTLDHIEVLMFRLGGIFDPTGDPILSVYATSAGLPTGAPLATATVPEANVPFTTAAFVSFDVNSAAIPVGLGDVLAFAISTTSEVGPYFLLTHGDTGQPEDYAAGTVVSRFLPAGPWSALTQDHGFRTYVVPVPEPQSLVLLGLGLAAVVAMRRRRR
jgi:hypothetical protein